MSQSGNFGSFQRKPLPMSPSPADLKIARRAFARYRTGIRKPFLFRGTWMILDTLEVAAPVTTVLRVFFMTAPNWGERIGSYVLHDLSVEGLVEAQDLHIIREVLLT